MKQLNIPISEETHRQAKAAAAIAGVTLAVWVERLILEVLKQSEVRLDGR